jgi:hypothetical protein
MAEKILEPNKEVMKAGVDFALETILTDVASEGKKVARLTLEFTDLPKDFPHAQLHGKVNYADMVNQVGLSQPVEGTKFSRSYFFNHESEKGWYRNRPDL